MSPELIKALRLIEIKAKKAVTSRFSGTYRSAFKSEGIVFSDVRPYCPGDDVRRIDWNVTARTGEPFLKQFEEERELSVIIALDSSASFQFSSGETTKSSVALELASILGFSAIKHQDRVGLLRFSESVESFIPPKKGRNHLMRLMTDIMSCPMTGKGTNLSAVCDYLVNLSLKKSVIFLISDFQDEGYESSLRILGRKHDLIPIIIEDPREITWPDLGRVRLKDLETGQTMVVNMGDPVIRQRYQNMVLAKRKADDRHCASAGSVPMRIDVTQPYMPRLLHYFEAMCR